jgi:hypothetical protein
MTGILVNVRPPVAIPPDRAFCAQVVANNGDAEEVASTGVVTSGSSDLEFTRGRRKQQILGMRWTNLPILPGTTFTQAYIVR